MWSRHRFFLVSGSVVGVVFCWILLVQAQQVPQQFPTAGSQRPAQAAPQRNVVGLPIYSADGARLGEITGVQIGPDGRVQAMQAELGYVLGFGAHPVLIGPDDLELRDNHVELPMQSDEIRAVLMQQPQ